MQLVHCWKLLIKVASQTQFEKVASGLARQVWRGARFGS